MLINLKIAVNPAHTGKKVIIVRAWKIRGTHLAIHKRCGGKGYNITQTQVGLYIPPTAKSLCIAYRRYKQLTAVESWYISQPVFGKNLGKKYNHLKDMCK